MFKIIILVLLLNYTAHEAELFWVSYEWPFKFQSFNFYANLFHMCHVIFIHFRLGS